VRALIDWVNARGPAIATARAAFDTRHDEP
jgi:hypothetical protein